MNQEREPGNVRQWGRRWSLPVRQRPAAATAAQTRQIAVVLNPTKRQARQAQNLIEDQARRLGWPRPLVLPTSIAEPGGPQTRTALARGADLIIAVGGDGTLRQVAHELTAARIRAEQVHAAEPTVLPSKADIGAANAELGIVALGTANLFARNLLLAPRPLADMVSIAVRGSRVGVDVGRAAITARGQQQEETFLVVAGIGRDAQTVSRVSPVAKKRIGWAAYLGPAISTALSRSTQMRWSLDGAEPVDVDAWCILLANCGRIPGGIQFVENALLDDGQFETLLVSPQARSEWVAIGAKGLFDLRNPVQGLSQGSAQRVVIEPKSPQWVQLDGDLHHDVTRLEAEIVPKALTVRVGR